MSTQTRQIREMTAAELIMYGRRSHSIVAWELVALEMERRLVTRMAGTTYYERGFDAAYHERDYTPPYPFCTDYTNGWRDGLIQLDRDNGVEFADEPEPMAVHP